MAYICSKDSKTKCSYAKEDGSCSLKECEFPDLIESPDYNITEDNE